MTDYRGLWTIFACLLFAGCSGPSEKKVSLTIVDRPISFSTARRDATRDYIVEHYGKEYPGVQLSPKIIVLHWTAMDTLEAAFKTFDIQLDRMDRCVARDGRERRSIPLPTVMHAE